MDDGRPVVSVAPSAHVLGSLAELGPHDVHARTASSRGLGIALKLEDGDNRCAVVAAGGISRYAVDGAKPDKWRLDGAPLNSGDWYKVIGKFGMKTGIFIKADGEPARFAPAVWMLPVLLSPECDYGSSACSGLSIIGLNYLNTGGRKKEPEWTLTHPEWACP